MAAHLTRCYNVAPEQLRAALAAAIRDAFPTVRAAEWPPGNFAFSRGMHWPLMSYGERVELRLSGPGRVELSSRYAMPTQVFELGDNLDNVERIVAALERRCATLPAACPSCGQPAPETRFCTACGLALCDPLAQGPLTRRAGRVRALAFVISLALPLLLIGAFMVLYMRLIYSMY
jgi:hypothetical protein